MKKIGITEHAYKRISDRLHLKRKAASKHVQIAFYEGTMIANGKTDSLTTLYMGYRYVFGLYKGRRAHPVLVTVLPNNYHCK